LGIPVQLPGDGEFGAALGAARLGMVAATGATPESAMTPPPINETMEPELSLCSAFDDGYHKFREAYPKIKSLS